MRTARFAFVACLLGLTVGFFAGRARVLRVADPDPFQRKPLPPVSGVDASGGGDREAELEAKLARAEAELAALRVRAAELSEGRLGFLRAKMEELLRARRGPQLLRLMGEFAALGGEGMSDAASIWEALIGDPEFGVGYEDRVAALTHWMPDLAVWALMNPGSASKELRLEAAGSFTGRDLSAAYVLGFLRNERDPDVAQQLAIFMPSDVDESMLPDLEGVARAHAEDPHVVDSMLLRIESLGTDGSEALLRALAHDADGSIAEAAGWQLLRRSPPAAGMQVERIPTAGSPGADFRRGDVITAVDGVSIRSADDWNTARSAHSDSETDVVLTVNRNGAVVPLRISGKDLGGIAAKSYVLPGE
ncbi:MAG: PDZ domain-containing protein [Planctomycetes bacterium]|nr:PDZ domain-containing protein [Planctomycetota bacterium]